MAQDRKGHPLELGDRVFLPGTIVSVHADIDMAQITIQVDDPDDVGPPVALAVCSLLCERIHFEEDAGGYQAPLTVTPDATDGMQPAESDSR